MTYQLKRGFSLIEMIVIIAILGVLTSITLPSITKYQKRMEEETFFSLANSMYQKTVACLYSAYPSYINFSEGIFVSYPFFYDLTGKTGIDDYFSTSNFSSFLKYWYKQMEIDASNTIEEYLKGSYENDSFNNGNLKVIISENIEFIFSMFLYVDRYKTQLYAEIDYIEIKDIEENFKKVFEM